MEQENIFTDSAFVELLIASRGHSYVDAVTFAAEYKSMIFQDALAGKISSDRAYLLINVLGLKEV